MPRRASKCPEIRHHPTNRPNRPADQPTNRPADYLTIPATPRPLIIVLNAASGPERNPSYFTLVAASCDFNSAYTARCDAVNATLLNEFLKEHSDVAEQESTMTR